MLLLPAEADEDSDDEGREDHAELHHELVAAQCTAQKALAAAFLNAVVRVGLLEAPQRKGFQEVESLSRPAAFITEALTALLEYTQNSNHVFFKHM